MKQEIYDKAIEFASKKYCYTDDFVPYNKDLQNGFLRGYEFAQEEYASNGMRWVKASERLPEKEGVYRVNRAYGIEEESGYFTGTGFTNYDGYRVIEWLDESNESHVDSSQHKPDFETVEAGKADKGLDLKKLEEQVDTALAGETDESLNAFFDKCKSKENEPVELQERANEYVNLQGVSYPMATAYQDMVRSQIFKAYLDGASTQADRIKELEEQLTLEKGGVESLLRDKKELEAELAEAKEKIKDLEKWSNRTMDNLTHKRSVVKEQKKRIEELEAENEILKMENSHSKLVVDEAKREIDRLRGLVEEAYKTLMIWKPNSITAEEDWQKFKANNNL